MSDTNTAVNVDKVILEHMMDALANPIDEGILSQVFILLRQRREMCRHRGISKTRNAAQEANAIDYVQRINRQIAELLQLY